MTRPDDAPERPREIVLCVDCEGTGEQIEKVYAPLLERGLAANFFFVGRTAEENADLVRRISATHQCESHSLSHVALRGLGYERQRHEIVEGRRLVEAIIGRPTHGFRAPCHSLDRRTVRILNEEGFLFDVSGLYFRYDMGDVYELRPTWFREWMPLYGLLGLPPRLTFGVFRRFVRRRGLSVLPIHPHYSARNDRLHDAYRHFLDEALALGGRFLFIDDLLERRGLLPADRANRWRLPDGSAPAPSAGKHPGTYG